ncbi:MAG TPA: hypothetical protein VI636_05650 [Candidatus Angelobacter sp.]
MLESLSIVLYLVITLAVPTLAIWGWVRWARSVQPRTPSSTISLIGFALSNVSAALAIATAVYAQVSGGFSYYDPVLIDIYGTGLLLSLGGLACGLVGLLRPNPLRWHAPVCCVAMFVFWLLSAVRE